MDAAIAPVKTLKEQEQAHILATLARNEGDKQVTANQLGISLKTLYNKLNEYESAVPGAVTTIITQSRRAPLHLQDVAAQEVGTAVIEHLKVGDVDSARRALLAGWERHKTFRQ